MTNEEYYLKELLNIQLFFTPVRKKLYNKASLERLAKVRLDSLSKFVCGQNKFIKKDYLPKIVKTLELYCSYQRVKREITIQLIKNTVCEYLNLPQELMDFGNRKRENVKARQVCHYFAKEFTKLSLSQIGKVIGDKDHSTVLFSVKTVKNDIVTNKEFAAMIEEIRKLLK
jgi:chromosomal replication initiation ATPase DnaA